MKTEMITLKHGETTIKMPSSDLARLALSSVFAVVLPQAIPAANTPIGNIPAVGEYWPGEGGLNGGLVAARDDVPAHYLIIAKDDAGNHEWGGRGKESAAFSKTNGMANTLALNAEGDHPAAKAASAYTADGHADFYLPACAELYHCWVSVPELFAKDCYYWSSSQRSAHSAFHMDFADGGQYYDGKYDEVRVRPVRRLFI